MRWTAGISISRCRNSGKSCSSACVLVPFGNGNRRLLAVVVDFAAESEYKNTKTVIDVVDAPVEIDAFTIECVLFLKSRTFCSFGSALRAVLPRGLSVATEETYAALPAEAGAGGACRRGVRLPARCGTAS